MDRRRITPETATGTAFAGTRKHLTFPRLWAFSGGPLALDGWPKRNLHTDPGFARRIGVASVRASAGQYQGYVVELLVDLFGEEWLGQGNTMDVRFVKVVPDGAELVAHALVRERRPVEDGTEFTLDVSCVDDAGDAVLVGTTTGVVR